MKRIIVYLVLCCIVAIVGRSAFAQQKGPAEAVAQGLVETVAKGCEKELTTYCKDVTPGEARILACLYAFEDKLSGQCEYALYDTAVQLERVINAVAYVANECRDDLTKFCSDIKPGEGRLLQCIDKNEAKVSKRCKQALKDTGLKK
ncbi:MAG TPA: cysteine rich repeat-containing protein [Nitrospirota bacterium]